MEFYQYRLIPNWLKNCLKNILIYTILHAFCFFIVGSRVSSFACHVPNCFQEFSTVLEYELHYNSCHRFICAECKKSLPSPHLLDLHLSETHDSFFLAQADRKPMFSCFVEDCAIKSNNAEERRKHCIEVHKFPHDFRFDQSLKKQNKAAIKQDGFKKQTEAIKGDVPKVSKGKPFTFGRQGRTFNQQKPWHKRGTSSDDTTNKDNSLDLNNLMETLPSE